MSIEVEGPDGAVHEFPDDTSPDVIKGVMGKHYGAPSAAPKDTGFGKALAYGTEGAAKGLGATIAEAGKYIGGGKTFPKWMDAASKYIHDKAGLDNYQPAGETVGDSSKPFMERLGQMPRAVVEGAPGFGVDMAAGAVGGPAGFIASNALRNAGNNANAVRRADNTPEDERLSLGQMARAGGATAADAALSRVGVGSVSSAPLKEVGKDAILPIAKNLGKAIGVPALVGAGQTVADKGLIEGKLPEASDVALNATTGAALGGAAHLPSAVKEGLTAHNYAGMANLPADSLARTANLLKRSGVNSESAAATAMTSVKAQLSVDANNAMRAAGFKQKLTDLQKQTNFTDNTRDVIDAARTRLRLGEKLDKADIDDIRTRVGGNLDGDKLVRALEDHNTLNHVQDMGNLQGGTFSGGVMGSDFGRNWLTPFSGKAGNFDKYLGAGAVLGGAAGHYVPIVGHIPAAAAAGTLAGRVGIAAMLKAADRTAGLANPAKTIVSKFADGQAPSPITSPSFAAQQMAQGRPALPGQQYGPTSAQLYQNIQGRPANPGEVYGPSYSGAASPVDMSLVRARIAASKMFEDSNKSDAGMAIRLAKWKQSEAQKSLDQQLANAKQTAGIMARSEEGPSTSSKTALGLAKLKQQFAAANEGDAAESASKAEAAAKVKEPTKRSAPQEDLGALTNVFTAQKEAPKPEHVVSTAHGEVIHNPEDTFYSDAARADGRNLNVHIRDNLMSSSIDGLSKQGKKILLANKSAWNRDLTTNRKHREEALDYVNNHVLPKLPESDRAKFMDHLQNTPFEYDRVNKDTGEITPESKTFFETWRHMNLDELNAHKERQSRAKVEKKK